MRIYDSIIAAIESDDEDSSFLKVLDGRTEELLEEAKSWTESELNRFLCYGVESSKKTISSYKKITQDYIRMTNTLCMINEVYLNEYSYIYILKSKSGHFKIGMTKNVRKRISSIETYLPLGSSFTKKYKVHSELCSMMEKYLHKKFIDKQLMGEWFALTDNDIKEIESKFYLWYEKLFLREKNCLYGSQAKMFTNPVITFLVKEPDDIKQKLLYFREVTQEWALYAKKAASIFKKADDTKRDELLNVIYPA